MLNVFLIEDSEVIRQNLTETLSELANAQVMGFADSQKAAERWLAENPTRWDLAVVDVFLKEGSGLGVLSASALATRSSKQRIVVLTNYATPDIREHALRLGADRVFDKSTDIDALIEYCLDIELDTPNHNVGGSTSSGAQA